ncbi:MAG: hypothetical protein CMP18_01470 [Rickettsiales bacterium]|jgi:serine/threonine-protein kinase HipA|nr:hypothetical protein [Rickettsiales bacterium]|tara:strand:- start:2539 stop:3771 length:1233 start_codon:yes stop_codon:yes gene_type:complete
MSKQLNILYNQEIAASLSHDEFGYLQLKYNQDWLESKNSCAISCNLPLSDVTYKEEDFKNFFLGILPESYNKDLIANILRVGVCNYFDLLKEIGGECPGAISFVNDDKEIINDNQQYKKLSEIELYNLITKLPKNPLLAGHDRVRFLLSGEKSKLGICIDDEGSIFLPLNNAPSTHILKPQFNGFSNYVINTAICLNLAKICQIHAVNAVIGVIGNIDCLLVQRYDRIFTKNNHLVKLHQEDFCQILRLPPKNKYQQDGGPSLFDCFNLLRNNCSIPAANLSAFLNMILFNLIIGNNRAHGKNFSLIYYKNISKIAPLYDAFSTLYYNDTSQIMAMSIGGEYNCNNINLKEIEIFCNECCLSFPLVKKRIYELSKKIYDNIDQLSQKYCDGKDVIAFIKARSKIFQDKFC